MNRRLTFCTSNTHKLGEASAILGRRGIKVVPDSLTEKIEIQSMDVRKIAQYSLDCIPKKREYFVEDTGIFIKALNGFPGPFAAYTFKSISYHGILRLLATHDDRSAYFLSAIAFRDKNGNCHMFEGRIDGHIAHGPAGDRGFGFDPIFVPDVNSNLKTFAELDDDLKNRISHRGLALDKLALLILNS